MVWRSWLHCCDACDAGPNQECSVIFFFLPAAYCFRAALLCRPGGRRAASRLLFLCPEPQISWAPRRRCSATARARAAYTSFGRSFPRFPLVYVWLWPV